MTVDREVMTVPVVLEGAGQVPVYAHVGDAGADLVAAIDAPVVLYPGCRVAVKTGVCCAVPEGFELQVRARSGLALNHGIGVLNAPGTVDAGFRGEIRVILINQDQWQPFTIKPGMRIAQAVLARVVRAVFVPVDDLDDSERGAGGFGSSG